MPKGETKKAAVSLPKRPTFNSADLSEALRNYNRGPFLDLLAAWIECAPSPEDILSFAQKKPDMWVKALTDLAKISGYTEKQEVLHTVNVNQMSDAALEEHAKAMAAKLGLDPSAIKMISAPSSSDPQPIPSKNPLSREFDGDIIDVIPE